MAKKEGFKISYLYPLLFLVIFISVILLLFYERDCKDSEACFNDAFKTCDKSKVIVEEEKNIFEYKIIGSKENSCIVKITILEVDPNSRREVIENFEGKHMTCTISKNIEGNLLDKNAENLLNQCTGPLKEAVYELIIEKIYNLLAENLGEIISKAK